LKRKRGGNRRADALCERDAVAIARLMHTQFMSAKEAGEVLGIPARRAQRLARKGLSNTWLYTPEHIEHLTEMHTSIVTGKGDFELSLPEPVQTAPEPQGEDVVAASATPVATPPVEPARPNPVDTPRGFLRLRDGTLRRVTPQALDDTPEAIPLTETFRQRQVRLQEEENGYQLTLRGRQKSAWEGDDNLEY
jgi:hypothetical protein